MRSAFSIGLVMAAVSPALADHADVVTAADVEPLAGNVLVWDDARLYLDASDKAPSIQLATLDGPRKDALGRVMPLRVVATSGAFIEVEPTKDVECAWVKVLPDETITKLRWFVKRSDLAEVVFKSYDAQLSGGTRITIDVGVPIGHSKDGAVIVPLHGDELPAAIPATSIAHSYKPHPIAPMKEAAKSDRLLAAGSVALGDKTVNITGSWLGRVEPHGKLVLFTLRARCLKAIVAAPKAAILANPELGWGQGIGIGGGMGVGEYLPKGTALTAPGATHVVAVTTADIWIPSRDVSLPTVCIDAGVSLDQKVHEAPQVSATKPADRKMRLCAPVSVLKQSGRQEKAKDIH